MKKSASDLLRSHLLGRKIVSDQALTRTAERRATRAGYSRAWRIRKIKEGTYWAQRAAMEHTGFPTTVRQRPWTLAELEDLLMPLTLRELTVVLGRSLGAVEQKVEFIRDLLLYQEGRRTLRDLNPRQQRNVKRYFKPGPVKVFNTGLRQLLAKYELTSQTFRPRDEHGSIVPTIIKRR